MLKGKQSLEHRGTIDFQVGDAVDLPNDLMDFDLFFLANLICRFLTQKVFKPPTKLGSIRWTVLLATPFTWLEEFTVRNGLDLETLKKC